MNKKFTKLIAALALLVFMTPTLAGWGQTRDEEVYSTCLFGGTHGYSSDYLTTWTATNGSFSWSVANGNTNGNSETNAQAWNYVKFGRKNNTSVGTITTSIAYSEAITKVDVTIDALTVSKINSIKLYTKTTSSNASWTEVGSFTKATGTQTVTLSSPAANLYYKIEFDCASGSSNGLITVSKVEYYHDAAPAGPSVTLANYEINAPAAGIDDGTLNVTYNNINTPLAEVLICDAGGNETTYDWFDAEIDDEDNVYYTVEANTGVARTAYFKVWSYDDELENEIYSDLVTVTQAGASYTLAITENVDIELSLFDGEENEIEIVSGAATIEAGTEARVSFGIAEGVDCRVFDVLTVKDANNQPLQLTEITPNVYYSFTMPTSNATLTITTTDIPTHTLTLGELSNVTLAMKSGSASADVTFTNNEATLCEGINVTVTVTVANGCVMGTVSVVDANNQSVEVTYQGPDLDGKPVYSFTMPAANATITATATLPPTYSLVTSIGDLVSGKHYIIASGTSGNDVMAMGYQKSSNRDAVAVTFSNDNKIVYNEDVYEFVINGPEIINVNNENVEVYTIYDANYSASSFTGGYLYASSGSSNQLKTRQFNTDNNSQWSIVIDGNIATITAHGSNSRNLMRFNPNNGSPLFACYDPKATNPTGTLPYLYVKDDDSNYEFYKDIAKYTTPATGDPVNGWNFIALPVTEDFTPDATMTSNTYDLYQLNDTKWENWRSTEDNGSHYHFNLVNGRGYLYANSANTTLHFSGAINTFTTDNNANVKGLSTGWNLIGNPYNIPIYINKPYYKMNAAGTAVETAEGITSVAIPACAGVVVYAGEDESVTFTTSVPSNSTGNNGNIQMTLAQQATNRGTAATLDNAIVSFNEGSQLGKFYFGTQNANLYIPQGTEEYAIVSTEAQGEMPVNFRANENGQYTLTVNPENVEMNYLHLIDNMTGADIDLLQTPSYTFNANVTDYESRFKLVFASDASTGSASDETFAFYSNGNWIINNVGNATLQVVDLMGRILSSETVNGSVSKTINATPGVYMLRLINGENVKVQKVVIE